MYFGLFTSTQHVCYCSFNFIPLAEFHTNANLLKLQRINDRIITSKDIELYQTNYLYILEAYRYKNASCFRLVEEKRVTSNKSTPGVHSKIAEDTYPPNTQWVKTTASTMPAKSLIMIIMERWCWESSINCTLHNTVHFNAALGDIVTADWGVGLPLV